MSEEQRSGQTVNLPVDSRPRFSPRPAGAWQRWSSLRGDILRHLHSCDSAGASVTVDQLAEQLDEALGLVERRAEELESLRLVRFHPDRRIELYPASRQMCG